LTRPFDNCWFLTGPTAAGKSAAAVELAGRLDAEIVSMDSMALYRGMDLGTAKPTPAQRQRVAHHLVDCLDPWQPCSLAHYLCLVEECVRQLRSRGRQALFVGGTPLYLKALLRGIFQGPAADGDLRRRLQALADAQGAAALHARLAIVDRAAADRLHPNDLRRVIRAIEVYEKTGVPLSEHQRQFAQPNPRVAGRVVCLELPRPELYDRINRRVVEMFEAGLVAEVEALLHACRPLSRTARQALGYKEVIEHLQGERDLAATVALVQRRTRRFAKHQGTWFRSFAEIRQVPLTAGEPAVTIADSVELLFRSTSG
jgi:tRNA dimethylallyltransferase